MDLRFSEWRALEDCSFLPRGPGIYVIRNMEDNKKYVGQSVNLLKRVRVHFWAKNPVSYLHKAINCHGFKKFEVQFASVDEDLLSEAEVWCIKQFDTQAPRGYNLTWGGEGSTGYVMTQASKDKLSKSIKGLPKPADFGLKISAANRARWADPAARARQGELSRSRTLSEEAREKIRKAATGRVCKSIRQPVVVNLHGIYKEFETLGEAAKFLQIAQGALSQILQRNSISPSMWENQAGQLVRVHSGPTRWLQKVEAVGLIYKK